MSASVKCQVLTPIFPTLDLTFRVYGSTDGEDLLWQTAYTGLAVEDGYFRVLLGDGENGQGQPLNVTDLFATHDETWLVVCVGDDCALPDGDLKPRQQVGSVPFCIRCGDSDRVEGQTLGDLDERFVNEGQAGAIGPAEIAVGFGLVPKGAILMWTGEIDDIPSGWALCDGTGGTPDLRDRFIVGAGSSYSVAEKGGETTHTMTVAEMPSHIHSFVYSANDNGGGAGGGDPNWPKKMQRMGVPDQGKYSSDSIGPTGGNSAHENRPPYFALAYIMKL